MFGIETKRVNEAVKNNPEKFPDGYVIYLDHEETEFLRSKTPKVDIRNQPVENFDRFKTMKHSSVKPKAFTDKGLNMLATILKSPKAKETTIAIIETYAKLEMKSGRNFVLRNVRRMMQFASDFSDFEIVAPLATQLTWSHLIELFPLKSLESKMYYAQNAIDQNLGKRELRNQISRKAFERNELANIQLLAQQPDLLNTFKDPYILDFLNLKNTHLEDDLETALLRELESFVLELGKGFAFMERQKRMIIDGDDFYLDLLFYNRNLKRLVAIELKIGKFEAAHKGQMELYLKWLNKYEKQEGENEPIGLILCAESNKEQVELLEMHKDGILVAEYWTVMPPKALLEAKLHQLLIETRERIERNKRI